MTRQIAVRLPDDLVDFLDECVAAGQASSRAAAVTRALERQRRRAIAARDARILAEHAAEPHELDDLARYVADAPIELD